eukprot:TRINITY_DN1590_c0_g1_i11.p1 TRINITY_DN1590_c0_g1~~TRINITY_DN1590_c0_g1_i11.p1  ORF type:complete len:333 (+),score=60.10 TRINITY_DN1590_c0_g1_i11:31-1029(+)
MENPLFSLVHYEGDEEENHDDNREPSQDSKGDGVVRILSSSIMSPPLQHSGKRTVGDDEKPASATKKRKGKRRSVLLGLLNYDDDENDGDDAEQSEESEDLESEESQAESANRKESNGGSTTPQALSRSASRSGLSIIVNGGAKDSLPGCDQIASEVPNVRSKLNDLVLSINPVELSQEFQESLEEMEVRLRRDWKIVQSGKSINQHLRDQKHFRNPTIYEKLVENMGIAEIGSNMPLNIFDPSAFRQDEYYGALAEQQRAHMEKLRLQPRTKIEFAPGRSQSSSLLPTVTIIEGGQRSTITPAVGIGVSAGAAAAAAAASANQRRSKWDAK